MPDGTKIDSLFLEVSSDSAKAVSDFEKLEKSLSKLGNVVSSFNSTKFEQMGTSMKGLADASRTLHQSLNGLSFGKLITDTDRLNHALDKSANALANSYGIKGKKAIDDLRGSLAQLYSATDKQMKFGNAESMYDFSRALRNSTNTLAENARKVDESEEAYVRLAEAVSAANKAGSKIHLPKSIKEEYGDDYKAMRDSLGKAFTTSDKSGKGTDFETWLGELNDQLGGIIDMSHGAEDAFGKFVDAVERGKKAQEVSGKELFSKGLLDEKSVSFDLEKRVGKIWEMQQAMKESGKDGAVAEGEQSQFDILVSRIKQVTEAVNEKTQAFRDEASVVGEVIGSEANNLTSLANALKGVTKQLTRTAPIIKGMGAAPIFEESKPVDDIGVPLSKSSEETADLEKEAEDVERLSEEEDKLSDSANKVSSSHVEMSNSISSLAGILKPLASAISSLSGKFASLSLKGVGNLFAKEAKGIGSLTGKLLNGLVPGLSKVRESHNGFVGSMKMGLMNMLKYGLGIRSLFVLMNKLRSAMVAGFGNLSKYSADTKSNLDSLSTGLSSLQNALAVAFNPILDIVTPILSTLIDYAIAAANAIAMLFAVLSGSGTYVKAKRIASGVGAIGGAAGGAGGAVKELKRELLGFDEITKLQDDASGGGGGGGGGGGAGGIGDMFDTEEISADMKSFAEKLKNAWKTADFTEIGEIIGTKLKEGLDKIPWNTLESYASRIGSSFATFINGAIEVQGLGTSIGNTIGNAFNVALAGVSTFVDKLHFDSVGFFIADALNGAISSAKFQKLGETMANAINGAFQAVNAFSSRFNFEKLASAISSTVNSYLSNIDWNTALSASSKIGSGIAKVINGTITSNTFGNIGSTIANAMNVAIKGVKSLGEDINWTQVGNAISNSLNTFFNTFNWSNAGLTLSTWTTGLLNSMVTAVKGINFYSLGTGIANAIKSIAWKDILSSAGSLIAETLGGLVNLSNTVLTKLFGSEFANYTIDVKNATKALENANKEIKTRVEEADKWVNAGTEYQYAKDLADRYFDLAEKEGKTNEEFAEQQRLAGELKTFYPELEEFYNNETGLLDTTREAVSNYIEKLKEKAKQEAATNSLTKYYEAQLKAKETIAEATDNIEQMTAKQGELDAAAAKAAKEAQEAAMMWSGDPDSYAGALADANLKAAEAKQAADANREAIDKQKTILDEATDSYEKAAEGIDNINEYLYGMEGATKNANDALGNLYDKFNSLPEDKKLTVQAILDDDSLSFDQKRIQILAELTGLDTETLSRDQRLVDKLWGNLDEVIDKTNGKTTIEKVNANIVEAQDKIPTEKKTIKNYTSEITKADDKIPSSQKEISTKASYNSVKNALTDAQRTISTWASYNAIKNKLSDAKRTISTWAKYNSSIDNLKDSQKKINTKANFTTREYNAGVGTISGWTAKLTSWVDGIASWTKTIGGFIAKLTGAKAATGGIYSQGRWSPITSHANGGILINGGWKNVAKLAGGGVLGTQGQMFIARESGPELVGNLNGHTAVMNNNQIVASVSDGVAKGVYRAMIATGNGNKNVTVNVSLEGDARGLFRVVQRENNKIVQSTGRPALLV